MEAVTVDIEKAMMELKITYCAKLLPRKWSFGCWNGETLLLERKCDQGRDKAFIYLIIFGDHPSK